MANEKLTAQQFRRERCMDMTQLEAMEAYAAYYYGVMSQNLVDILEKISTGGCIASGDGTNPNCCAYCAAAAAIRAHRAAQGTRKAG